jgi:hypothetical protein
MLLEELAFGCVGGGGRLGRLCGCACRPEGGPRGAMRQMGATDAGRLADHRGNWNQLSDAEFDRDMVALNARTNASGGFDDARPLDLFEAVDRALAGVMLDHQGGNPNQVIVE